MATVFFCLLPVIATGHRYTTPESTATTGVPRFSKAMTVVLSACTSIVLAAVSMEATVTMVGVFVPS